MDTIPGPEVTGTMQKSAAIKRKWNDDVVFRNQARGEKDHILSGSGSAAHANFDDVIRNARTPPKTPPRRAKARPATARYAVVGSVASAMQRFADKIPEQSGLRAYLKVRQTVSSISCLV